jgi:hypothetical protein
MSVKSMLLLTSVIFALAACTAVEKRADLSSAVAGRQLTAGPGDTVMDFRITKPLPNAFGKADIFGRRTDAGRTVVRFMGSQGRTAYFERSDVSLETNATTMNQTPMMIPQTSRTTMTGTIASTPVAATAESRSYSYIGPSPVSGYATASAPIGVPVAAGQTIQIQGRSLTVHQVTPASVTYSVN